MSVNWSEFATNRFRGLKQTGGPLDFSLSDRETERLSNKSLIELSKNQQCSISMDIGPAARHRSVRRCSIRLRSIEQVAEVSLTYSIDQTIVALSRLLATRRVELGSTVAAD